MIRRIAALLCGAAALLAFSPSVSAASGPAHVVIVTIPGFDWNTFARAQTPVLHGLIDTGAVAALSVRSATSGSTPLRGYLTLGAGNRAFAVTEQKPRRDELTGQIALLSSQALENGTAAEAMARRVVHPRNGEIVVPDAPALDAAQRNPSYGTRIGNLGATLARNGVARAVVVAGDLRIAAQPAAMRRGAALSLVDRSGTVDAGTVDGLVRPTNDAAYGVRTDPGVFGEAVRRALLSARVVVVEPGETLRADEFTFDATQREADAQKRSALERTDALIGAVASMLTARDTIYVIGVSSPLIDPSDRLTLAVAHGNGIERGWLTSPTTHRRGMVTLADVAPTVLDALGIAVPASMSGTPIRSVPSNATGRVTALQSLEAQSRFGDRFQGYAAKIVVALLASVALALAGFVLRGQRWRPAVVWLSLADLAVPPTAYIVRILPVYRLSIVGATLITCAIVAGLAASVHALPFVAWKSALVLAGLSFTITTGDLLAGAPLQVNNVFGYSPISAGRFYGNSNVEFAVLIATALIGIFGLLEIKGGKRAPAWAVLALAGVVAVQGLPQFGAKFGGLVATIPAMLVAYTVGQGRTPRIWRIAAWASAGAGAAIGVALLDMSRPPQARTHLGRFAAHLFAGGPGGVADIVRRKSQSNFGLLGSAWSWTLAIAVVVLLLLMHSNAHALRDIRRVHPMLFAALAGTLAGGLVGFAVNDTGIWVLGMTLAYVVPMGVLLAIDEGRIVSSDGRAHVQGSPQEAGRRGQSGP